MLGIADVSESLAITCVAGGSDYNSYFKNTSVFTGYFTLSELLPLTTVTNPNFYKRDIVVTFVDGTQLNATVYTWPQTVRAAKIQDLTLTLTGVYVPPVPPA